MCEGLYHQHSKNQSSVENFYLPLPTRKKFVLETIHRLLKSRRIRFFNPPRSSLPTASLLLPPALNDLPNGILLLSGVTFFLIVGRFSRATFHRAATCSLLSLSVSIVSTSTATYSRPLYRSDVTSMTWNDTVILHLFHFFKGPGKIISKEIFSDTCLGRLLGRGRVNGTCT